MSVITGKVTTNVNIVRKTPKPTAQSQSESPQKPFNDVLAQASAQQVVIGHQIENTGVCKKPLRK